VFSPGILRVTVEQVGAGAKEWHVKLVQRGYGVVAGCRYSVRFRARAGEPRPVGCAVGHDHEPWEAVGDYHEHVVTTEWTTFEGEFTSMTSDPSCRLFFDFARSTAWVELTDVVLRDQTHQRDLCPSRP